MRTIWKFQIRLTDGPQFILPPDPGAKLRFFAMQGGIPTVWVELEPEPQESMGHWPITVALIGTGHPVPDGIWNYFGSTFDGPFVWHLYEATA